MANGNFDFTPDGSLQGRIVWSSASKGAISNSSDATATLYARRTDSYTTRGQSWSGYVKIENSQVNVQFNTSISVGSSWIEMAKVSTTVSHSSDGSKSVAISGSITGPSGTALAGKTSSGSNSVELDRIARYTSITSFSVDKRDETSLTFKWQTADTIDYAWYSTDNGTTWTGYNVTDGTSGNFAVSNLSVNTSYNCKLRVRRKDSQLTTDSSRVTQTTYAYPYCTETPDFTIGNNVTLKFYNPLNRNIKIQMWSHVSQSFVSDLISINGTDYTGFNNISNRLYESIPNNISSKYNIDVWYGENKVIKEGGNYSIKGTETPTFTDFDYDDINEETLALTGNSKILIKGFSKNQITISSLNKAEPKNSATIKRYQAIQGTKNASAPNVILLSVTMSMANIDSNVITVSAVDSRELSTFVTKTLSNAYYKEYSDLIIKSINAKRSNNGVGENVTLSFNGTFWNNSFGEVQNDIISARYQYKETSSSSEFSSTKPVTVTKNGNNFNFSGLIEGDLGVNGFDIEKSYIIRIWVQDKLQTKIYDTILTSGTPAIAIYKSNVAIGQKYDENEGGVFQIKGKDVYSIKTKQIDYNNFSFNVSKFAKVVFLKIFQTITTTMPSGQNIQIGLLESGWRPSSQFGVPIIIRDSNYTNYLGMLIVRNNGNVEIVQNTGNPITTAQIIGTAQFFAE